MRIQNILIMSVMLFALSACVNPGPRDVTPQQASRMMHYEDGRVTGVRFVAITDNGQGGFVGAVTGAVLGSAVGGHRNPLATLGGGLLGAYVGSEAGRANAQQLTVRLDDGSEVIVIAKGQRFSTGQHVRIVTDDSRRVVSVEHN